MADVNLTVGMDVSGLERGKEAVKQATRDIKREVEGVGGGMKDASGAVETFGRNLMGLAAGYFSLTTIVGALRSGIKDAQEFNKQAAVTIGAVNAMGKPQLGPQLNQLAQKYESRTGVDDSQIAAMINKQVTSGITDPAEIEKTLKFALNAEAATAGQYDAGNVVSALIKGGADSQIMFKKMAQGMGVPIGDSDTMRTVLEKINAKPDFQNAAERRFRGMGIAGQIALDKGNALQKIGEELNPSLDTPRGRTQEDVYKLISVANPMRWINKANDALMGRKQDASAELPEASGIPEISGIDNPLTDEKTVKRPRGSLGQVPVVPLEISTRSESPSTMRRGQ